MVIDDNREIRIDYFAVVGEDGEVVLRTHQSFIIRRRVDISISPINRQQTKAEKNQARLKQLRGRAGRWA